MVDSTALGVGFISLKEESESNRDLLYKFRMLGIGVLGETNILSDNKSFCTNSSFLGSALNKNHNSISYHAVL